MSTSNLKFKENAFYNLQHSRKFGGDILRVIYLGLLRVLCSSQILCINNMAIFPEIILFNIKNATKEQNILPLISTIKTASLFLEYLNIPRTSTTTLQTSILPSMLQVGDYVYLWTHVRASSFTFGVFCVWISQYMLKCAFRHPFLAIIIRENLSNVSASDESSLKYDFIKDGKTCNRTVLSVGSTHGHS